jgi:hypothetical protein
MSPQTHQNVTFTWTGSCDRTPCTFAWQDDGSNGPAAPNSNLGAASGMTVKPLVTWFNFTGQKSPRLTVTNSQGQTATTSSTFTVAADMTPPDTTITSGPSNGTSTDASFSFTGTQSPGEVAPTFECQLDAGGYAACSSPKLYSGLPAGTHTFRVRAKDGDGNVDASPASWSWTITAAGSVIWSASGDAPVSSEWAEITDQSYPLGTTTLTATVPDSRITLVPGVKGNAYHIEVHDGDNAYGERAELGQGNPTRSDMLDRLFSEGQERWIAWQTRLETGYPIGTTRWNVVAQWKQLGSLGSPVLGMYVHNSQWYMQRTTSDPNNQWPPGFDSAFALGTARTGVWTKWLLHIKFSPSDTVGFVEFYSDLGNPTGVAEVLPHTMQSTMKVDGGVTVKSHARIGLYRDPAINGTAAATYDGYTVATTREAAEAAAF